MKSKKMVRLISLLISVLMIMGVMPWTNAMAAEQSWASQIPSKEVSGATFRLGVMSDSHIGAAATSANNLDKALAAFSELGDVDAVAMNGDMVYAPAASSVTTGKYVYNDAEVNLPAALYSKFKSVVAENGEFTLAGTQEGDVFTADTTQGKPIIYSVGNHEFPENDRDTTRAAASKQLFTEQSGRNANYTMSVGGYTFIQSAPQDFFNDFTAAEEFVKAQILAAEEADPTNKPIFYLQHEGVHGTVIGTDSTATGNTDEFKAFLNEHPRVIVLSAHTHAAEEDPRTIWQDGFTAVSTGKVGGGNVSAHGGSYSMGNNTLGSQCLMFDLTEGETKTDVKIYRLNILTGLLIGEPWEFSIDGTTETFKYNSSRYENPSIADFNDDAALTIVKEARQGFKFTYHVDEVTVTEAESYLQDNFVHSYRVVVKNTDADVVVQNFKVFADIFVADSDKVNSYSVTLPNQLDRATNYEISVYALTPFTAGSSLESLEAKGVTPVKYAFKTSEELTAEDEALIRTHENINVALNKPVYQGREDANGAMLTNGVFQEQLHVSNAGYPSTAPDIELPSGDTVKGATGYGSDWYIVDLGRRYAISQIKLYPCGSNYGYQARWMQNFAIDVSNDITFAEKVTLGGIGTDTEGAGVTSNSTPFTLDLSGNEVYRYVKVRRTGANDYAYGELQVFADVTTQEVSRNRQVEANIQYSNFGPSKAVDGTLTSNTNAWLVESLNSIGAVAPFNLVVDLEQDYPLGFIEMFGRYGSDNSAYRRNWKIYGYTNAQGKPDVNATDFSDGELLLNITSAYPQITNKTNPEGLKTALSGNGRYRYLVFSKYVREAAAIGELRAEIVIPRLAGVERISDTEVKVSFTEKMKAESLNAAGAVTLKTDSGTVYTPDSVTISDSASWDGGYDATLTFANSLPASGLIVTVDGDVKTTQGAALVKDASIRLSGKAIAINKSYSKVKENVNVALNKPVYSNQLVDIDGTVVMNPDAAKFTNGIFAEHVQPPAYSAGTVTLPSGDTVTASDYAAKDWYIIDLGERYKIEEIKVYSRGNEPTVTDAWMSEFDLEVSNSILFPDDDRTRVGGIGATIEGSGLSAADSSIPYVATLDGENAYRYVRIKKTAWTYYGFGEIEVIADLTATEVSRNKGVSVNLEGQFTTVNKVTDGVTSNAYMGWFFESNLPDAPYNLVLDLEAEYPIGYVELWGRGDETKAENRAVFRQNWASYGYADGTAPDPTNLDTTKGTKFFEVTKAYPASGLKAMAPSGSYRYLSFTKTVKEAACIGEIGAYVLNPTAYSAVAEDGKLTVTFTDKMEVSTFIEDNFTLGGVTLSNPVYTTGWDGGFSVTFDYDGIIADGMPLVISEKVRNEKGIELKADQTIAVKADKYILTVGEEEKDALVQDSSHTIKMAVYSEQAADVLIFAAVKSGETLVSCTPSDAVSIAKGEAEYITVSGITPKTGEKVYLYIWEKDTLRPIQAVTVIE